MRRLVKPFSFDTRSYNPPESPVNVLLSLGNPIIYNRFCEIIKSHGINSFEGILHVGRGSHQALASDYLECYRFLVDRSVLALINKKQIKLNNFTIDPDTGLSRLDSAGFHVFIHYMENIFITKRKLNNTRPPYELWCDKSVRKFLESARCGLRFRSYRYL